MTRGPHAAVDAEARGAAKLSAGELRDLRARIEMGLPRFDK